MYEYSIVCTEEQTKKAIELGAPIATTPMLDILRNELGKAGFILGSSMYWFPTAEQMIGWLEEQGVWIHFCKPNQRPDLLSFSVSNIKEPFRRVFVGGEYNSRKKTTLATIDAALDYLIKNKKWLWERL